jgi:hypothetical protein
MDDLNNKEEYQDSEIVIQNLLDDFSTQREALLQMVIDVEKLKTDIDKLFPEKLNARYAKFFEDKVKTAVSMFNVLLDIRKELLKTTKDEIDIRRKVVGKGDLNDLIDVRKLAGKIEKFDTTKEKLTKKKNNLKSGPSPELLMEEVNGN